MKLNLLHYPFAEEFRQMATDGQLNEADFIKMWNSIETTEKSAEPEDIGKRVFAFFDRDHSGKCLLVMISSLNHFFIV